MSEKLPAKIGRPTKYNEDWAIEFCELIAEGKSVHTICDEYPDQPAKRQVYHWLDAHEEFRHQYARAKHEAADRMAEKVMALVNNVPADAGAVQKARLQLDAYRWYLSKLAPKVYGDRVEHDIKGGVNFQPQILIQCSSDREEPQVKIATHQEPGGLQ